MRILRPLSSMLMLPALLVAASPPGGAAVVAPQALPQLIDVRAVRRAGLDRVIFQFDEGAPAGRAPLHTHREGGPRPPRRAFIGLARRTAVDVIRQPARNRVVIAIGADFPTVDRRVFFLDEDRVVANQQPYFVSVPQ